jgi:hypothetical protein
MCGSHLTGLPVGIGNFRHVEPAGTVPTLVSKPSAVVLNSICVRLSPPQRKIEPPTKSSGVFWNVSSVRGASAGANL